MDRYDLTIPAPWPNRPASLSRAAEITGMHPEMIQEFVRANIVHADLRTPDGKAGFSEHEISHLRLINHLRSTQHVNLRTVRYIVRLVCRLEAAEHEIGTLRDRLP